jgi:hypothetical protein
VALALLVMRLVVVVVLMTLDEVVDLVVCVVEGFGPVVVVVGPFVVVVALFVVVVGVLPTPIQ